jgi:hypothetical protein
VLISVCSLPRKNIRGHTQSPKLENPASNGGPVGSSEEEHPETLIDYWLRLARSHIRCKERTL